MKDGRSSVVPTVISILICWIFSCLQPLSQNKKVGNPEENLSPHITRLTGFGERAVYAPDGKRMNRRAWVTGFFCLS